MPSQAALVFVDWDCARRITPRRPSSLAAGRAVREIELALELLQNEIARAIGPAPTKTTVHWRLYHGWHRGETPTQDRLMFERFVGGYASRTVGNIVFGRDFVFGDDLLCRSKRNPLRYTLRSDHADARSATQKMIDTSLVVDLLQAARSDDYDYLIVIGDDDDLLPGCFCAEAWGAPMRLLRLANNNKLPLLAGRGKGFPVSLMTNRRAHP